MTTYFHEELNWIPHREIGSSKWRKSWSWDRVRARGLDWISRILEGFTGACGLSGFQSEYLLAPAVRSNVFIKG
jgi:hypothetical protein